jgi:hypothetical protein
LVDPHEEKKKDTTKETIRINARLPRPMGHVLNDQKESEKQATPPVEEWKGCMCIIVTKEGPNGRCSKDVSSRSKPRLLGGKRGQRKNKKN